MFRIEKQNVGSEEKTMNANRFVFSRFIPASYFAALNSGIAGSSVSLLRSVRSFAVNRNLCVRGLSPLCGVDYE
jgi:hypothetical protein